MPGPRLHDDGQTVTLDLHGLRVDEAAALARRTVEEAARRGRGTVRLVHGSSTSAASRHRRTIKHVLAELVERGDLPGVTSAFATGDALLLSLSHSADADGARIQLRDVW